MHIKQYSGKETASGSKYVLDKIFPQVVVVSGTFLSKCYCSFTEVFFLATVLMWL